MAVGCYTLARGVAASERSMRDVPHNPLEPQPDPLVTSPRSRPLRAQGYESMPGPTRHMHRRHFARQEGMGFFAMSVIVAVIVYFFGWDTGIWRSLFGG